MVSIITGKSEMASGKAEPWKAGGIRGTQDGPEHRTRASGFCRTWRGGGGRKAQTHLLETAWSRGVSLGGLVFESVLGFSRESEPIGHTDIKYRDLLYTIDSFGSGG